jgi:hypothetical protein
VGLKKVKSKFGNDIWEVKDKKFNPFDNLAKWGIGYCKNSNWGGKKHFTEIGKKGQEELRKRYPTNIASEWGKKGGRKRKKPLNSGRGIAAESKKEV